MSSNFKIGFLKFRFGLGRRISFYKRLMSYAEEGYPVYDTLVKFKKRLDGRKDPVGQIIGIWLDSMKRGKQFSQAIEGWVPDAELNLISSGEKGEGIHVGLKEAIRFTEAASKMKAVIVGGSIYPGALLAMALGFLAGFSKYLSPVFVAILPVSLWPADAQLLQGMSEFMVTYWYIGIGIAVAIGIVVKQTIGWWSGPFRKFADKLPPWSIYKSYNTAAFLITLSSMMKSGTPLNDSLKAMSKISSIWLNTYLSKMIKNLKQGGKNFGVALDVGLMDEETAGDVIDYSELGKFEKAIHSIGEQSIENNIKTIEGQMGVAKNLMLVVVAGLVGWIYFTSYNLNGIVAESASSGKPLPKVKLVPKK